MVFVKIGILNVKRHVLTFSDLSITLKQPGCHMALSCLVTLSISSLRNFDIEANTFYDRAHQHYEPALLTMCYTRPYIDPEISHIRHFILLKFNLSTKGLDSLTYPVYLKINLLSLIFLLTLKIRNNL